MPQTFEVQDPETTRHTVRRAMWIGLWIWPSFALLDAYMCFVAFPAAPFRYFVVGRVLMEGVLFSVYAASWRKDMPPSLLAAGQDMAFFLVALSISLMAVPLGGIRSSYMHGISIVLLVRAAMISDAWRRALPTSVAIVLSFPLVMVAGMLLSPEARAEWLARPQLISFAGNFVFVIASAAVGLASGHITWGARQQLYRARRLGRYRLQAPIGRGGMGEVWLAWDQSLRRNVALKLLRTGATPNPPLLQRFEREAQAASQLCNPHSVQIFDYGASDDGIHYIAMEYLTGMNLETLVCKHGPLAPSHVVHYALQICASLEEAHAAGVIHRDVKPQNLFVTRVGQDRDVIKLLDFGVARLRTPVGRATPLTQAGQIFGTPGFLAPEVAWGGEADERSDLYSFGATLYFLLTGVVPYDGGTLMEVIQAQLVRSTAPPSERRGEPLPAGLDALVLRCLEHRAEDRFESVAELRQALEQVPGQWTLAEAEAFWRSVEAG